MVKMTKCADTPDLVVVGHSGAGSKLCASQAPVLLLWVTVPLSFCLEAFQFTWDFLMAVVFIIQKLSDEWPGLHVCVKTPCRTAGCPAELIWPDMDGKAPMYVCAHSTQRAGA